MKRLATVGGGDHTPFSWNLWTKEPSEHKYVTDRHTLGKPDMTSKPNIEERSMSCGSVSKHLPRVIVTADFHGLALESRRRHSAHVAAPENCDLREVRVKEKQRMRR